MFGLTKREQRWKAEQQALDSMLRFTVELAALESRKEVKKPAMPCCGCKFFKGGRCNSLEQYKDFSCREPSEYTGSPSGN